MCVRVCVLGRTHKYILFLGVKNEPDLCLGNMVENMAVVYTMEGT